MYASSSMIQIASTLSKIGRGRGKSLLECHQRDLSRELADRWFQNAEKMEISEKYPGFPNNQNAPDEVHQLWDDLKSLNVREIAVTKDLISDAIKDLEYELEHRGAHLVGKRLLESLLSNLRYLESLD